MKVAIIIVEKNYIFFCNVCYLIPAWISEIALHWGDEALSNFCYADMQNNKIMIDITHCHSVNADSSY